MDKIDKKIITLLQQNARMPLKALAENVFLSSPAVSARIERLEKEEIIEGYEVKINQLKLGYHITAFINLEVAPVQKPDFYPFIKSCPNVVECNCVTGNYSMLLKVMFPSTMELDTFIGQLQKFGRTCPPAIILVRTSSETFLFPTITLLTLSNISEALLIIPPRNTKFKLR
jgi:Lrp/AsnC family transcriptional regulator, leucine-responsive regulatory protein